MRGAARQMRLVALAVIAGLMAVTAPSAIAIPQSVVAATVREGDTGAPDDVIVTDPSESSDAPSTDGAPGETDGGGSETGGTETGGSDGGGSESPEPSIPDFTVEPTDPGTETGEPTESGESGSTETTEPTGTATPTNPTTPGPTKTPGATMAPPQYDLGTVDFVDLDDLKAAGDDPELRSQLSSRAWEQLALIDKALRESQGRVDTAGKRYDDARASADQARDELKQLEDQIAYERDSAQISEEVLNLMVQRMRQGSYAVPPEINVLLEGGDMLYRYGVISSLAQDEAYTSQQAGKAAERLEELLPAAEAKRAEAEQLEQDAQVAKDEAVKAQQWLQSQLAKAETNSDVLLEVLTELGHTGDAPSDQLAELLSVRNSLRSLDDSRLTSGNVSQPLVGWQITDGFGYRTEPKVGMHWGTDFVNGNTCGAPLYAMAGGTVTYAGPLGTYGNHLEITTSSGMVYSYSHIMDNGIGVSVGEKVRPGQPVALAGTTGLSTGCHLHLEITLDGERIDPMIWMRMNGLA